MKKRMVTCLLASTLILSMGTTVFANADTDPEKSTITSVEDGNNSASHGVYGTYSGTVVENPTYSVDVEWGSLEFTYDAGTITKTWDPQTHEYTSSQTEKGTGWSCDTGENEIKVTNHSNARVAAYFTYTMNDAYGVKASFDKNMALLDSAVETEVSAAPFHTAVLTPESELGSQTEQVKIGTATVSLAGVSETEDVKGGENLTDVQSKFYQIGEDIYMAEYTAAETFPRFSHFLIIDGRSYGEMNGKITEGYCAYRSITAGHKYRMIFDFDTMTTIFEDITP